MWAVIRGSQQGGQGGLVGSEQSTTKQPFSSLAASLRGASQAYLSSRLLNRLTSGSHPAHTRSHTLSPALIPTDPEESRPSCSLADNFNFFFDLTQAVLQDEPGRASARSVTRAFTSTLFYLEFCCPAFFFFVVFVFSICWFLIFSSFSNSVDVIRV